MCIRDSGYTYQFSKLVKSKPVMEADSLYVRQFNPGELIDYYNTYKGDKTYQLEDVIKALHAPAKKVSVPLKDYTEEQWRELANDKKSSIEWFYSQADKAFYQVAKIGLGGAPVSYTHLDVYKRQLHGSFNLLLIYTTSDG